MTEKESMNRRDCMLKAASIPALTLVPRQVLGGPNHVPPSERVNLACVGVGAQGIRVMLEFLKRDDVQVVSVCDVNRESDDYSEWRLGELKSTIDETVGGGFSYPTNGPNGATCGRVPAKRIVEGYYAERQASGTYAGCSEHVDYRELLERENDVDAVVVGTPDHAHAVISIAAIQKGKHVYCQKPMTRTVHEARRMAEVARETGVATQVAVGNQASEETRLLTEWIADGAIGTVREVHNWSNRPFWPQGMLRPIEEERPPSGLNWDLWLGPAHDRPYHPAYLPFIWRGWRDFGAGALGDMGCYSFDTIFRALKLTAPEKIEASWTRAYWLDRGVTKPIQNDQSYPCSSMTRFHFPAHEQRERVSLIWYDGGMLPPPQPELEGRPLAEEALLFVGDKGKILCDFVGSEPELVPTSRMQSFKKPPKTLPRSPGHEQEWIDAIRGGPPAGANFEFEARVTETLLLGNVIIGTGKQSMDWDDAEGTSPDVPNIEKQLNPPYRAGWTL